MTFRSSSGSGRRFARDSASECARLPSSVTVPDSQPLIIGHRGAAAVAPENTLESFREALRCGADGVEFDIRLAKDGIPVVIHDANLRRTARRHASVSALTSAELAAVDAGTWFNDAYPHLARADYPAQRIPALRQVFETFAQGDSLLYAELKCGKADAPLLARKVADLVAENSLEQRVVVESFDLRAIAEVKRLAPGVRTAALWKRAIRNPAPTCRHMIRQALLVGASQIALHHRIATPGCVAEARRHGLDVIIWTVDAPSFVAPARHNNVYAVITNNPCLLVEQRRRLHGIQPVARAHERSGAE